MTSQRFPWVNKQLQVLQRTPGGTLSLLAPPGTPFHFRSHKEPGLFPSDITKGRSPAPSAPPRVSPRPAATDLVPRRPVGAAEEGGWQWLEASLWEVVPLLSRSQPSSRVLRSRCRRRAPGGAGCNRGCLSPPERPRRWAGAEQTQSLRRRLPPLPGCPAARLPQCIWGVGGRWAPGRGGGGGCGAGQKRPPIPAAGEPRAPGAPASLGLSHGDLCKRQHRLRLLQPRRRNHSDRGCPSGERSGRTAGGGGPARPAGALPERGGSPGPGCGRHGVRPAWLGGLQGKATHWRTPTRHLREAAGLSWDSGMKANCFLCSPAALKEALEVATRLPAHFQGFFLDSPLSCPSPFPPLPRTLAAAPLAWYGAGAAVCGAKGWPRSLLCCSCSVMSGCYRSGREWYRCAPDTGDSRLRPRLALPNRAQRCPSPTSAPWLVWVPVSARPKKNPRTHSQAPPERRLPARQSSGT